ncbi:enoyl-CoA hydratase [Zhengella mangrovi]|uniref:Enoyl-CoA hydratase n=1 Tax=Zhengella mangrovi TaxID=1982044 RepID=A0A2G1QS03_9HYPH|nr:crotonase/enoyl-CoA hydratase family protein [Zhengella mangrovi]PHP68234.1 enoyl-CoA hydratase [Zhengella mangrovi]
MTIRSETRDAVTIVTIDRPDARNAVNPAMATALYEAFLAFEADGSQRVAILTGVPGAFCAGFDLKAAAAGMDDGWFARHAIGDDWDNPASSPRPGPMGPTRLLLSKPVIAAISGAAVAGGMELALWCDLRVMEASAYMGVYCRRWGVPLIDGGTVRLPRIVGQGRAMDLILTGREVKADECLAMGLATAVAPDGAALQAALELAGTLARFPQSTMRADRMSALTQWGKDPAAALANEWKSLETFTRDGVGGAARFSAGKGRGGRFDDL